MIDGNLIINHKEFDPFQVVEEVKKLIQFQTDERGVKIEIQYFLQEVEVDPKE